MKRWLLSRQLAWTLIDMGPEKSWSDQICLAAGVSDTCYLCASAGRSDQLTFPQEFCYIAVLEIPGVTIWLHLISGHLNDYLQ